MLTALLIISYLTFLCRGIPDSIIGAAWPLMYGEFQISESLLSVLTISVSLFTAFASLVSSKLTIKLGTWKTLAISLFLLAVTVLGFGLSGEFRILCVLSIPLGFCAGTIDCTLNSYLATRYKAVFINLLHGFYGIGAILSPMLISLAITQKNNWRDGYFLAFYILMGIWAILMASYFMWKKADTLKTSQDENEEEPISLPITKQLRMKPVIMFCLLAIATNALEYSMGVWGATFFTDARRISPEMAASLITVLYAGMTVGRLLGAFLTIRFSGRKLIAIAIAVLSAVCLLFLFNFNISVLYVLMFIFGLTNGPIYPLMISITPDSVESKYSQSVIGTEIAAAYTGCVLTHIILGFLVKYLSIGVLPIFVIASFALMAVIYIAFLKQTRLDN